MPVIDYYGADGWGADDSGTELDRQRVAREVIARVWPSSPGARLLDIGCGDGVFLERLAATLPGEFAGVDYSGHQLAKAARLPYEFHKCDLAEGLPLADESFDIVHAAEIIEHLVDPDLMVDEAARVLRPGGHLVLTTPNLLAWYNRLLVPAGIQPVFHETSARSTEVGSGPLARWKTDTRPVGHLRLMHRAALTDLLRRSGMQPVLWRGARFHGVPGPLRWLDGMFRVRPSLASILVVVAKKGL